MEDNSEGVRDEQKRKPVFDNRSCPQCGNRVSWKRLHLKTCIWSKWECPVCASLLGVDRGRRVIIGLSVVPLAILPLLLFAVGPWYFRAAWIVLVVTYAFTFERIKTVRPGAERGGRPPLRSTV
ncbi:MAG: hypothetical protein ISS79_02285 [Phycisphaerae bacterium]|nr:hypothetical protein [Phycisphaerae bacterium]